MLPSRTGTRLGHCILLSLSKPLPSLFFVLYSSGALIKLRTALSSYSHSLQEEGCPLVLISPFIRGCVTMTGYSLSLLGTIPEFGNTNSFLPQDWLIPIYLPLKERIFLSMLDSNPMIGATWVQSIRSIPLNDILSFLGVVDRKTSVLFPVQCSDVSISSPTTYTGEKKRRKLSSATELKIFPPVVGMRVFYKDNMDVSWSPTQILRLHISQKNIFFII